MQAKIHNITVKFIFKPTENGMHENTNDTKIPQMTIQYAGIKHHHTKMPTAYCDYT